MAMDEVFLFIDRRRGLDEEDGPLFDCLFDSSNLLFGGDELHLVHYLNIIKKLFGIQENGVPS